jgi:thioredoxin reductase (NADPH)
MSECYDLIIIGAGPAGLSAAYAAKQHGLDYLVLERDQIANTVANYPLGKPLFSTPNELEFEPDTLRPVGAKPTREELLDYYHWFAEQQQQLRIHTQEAVTDILAGQPLTIITDRACYRTRAALMAVGGMGIFNRLDAPGESPARVSYLFRAATPFRGQHVVVAGGGNSAAEATLDLCAAGAQVTMLLRRSGLDRLNSKAAAIKPWVRQPLEAAVRGGKIEILFNARIIEILPDSVILSVNEERRKIKCDHIFALIGARPDTELLTRAGAVIGADGRPNYHPQTYETTVANLFVAGHLTRELHMKLAIAVPPRIVNEIAARLNEAGRKAEGGGRK